MLDLGKGEFVINAEAYRKNQVPVGVLLNKDDNELIAYTEKNKALAAPMVVNALLQIRNKIKTYQYTINFATDLTEDEQINWFEVLNNAGSRVSIIQMRFSKLKAHGIDVYTQYTHVYRNMVQEYGYDFFTPQKTNVSYSIAALNPAYEVLVSGKHSNNFAPISSDTKENQLCNLDPDKLKECFEMTLEALEKALRFIENNDLEKYNRYYDFMSRDFFKYLKELDEDQSYWLAPGSQRYVWKNGEFHTKAKTAYNNAVSAISYENSNYSYSAKQKWREIYGTKFPE